MMWPIDRSGVLRKATVCLLTAAAMVYGIGRHTAALAQEPAPIVGDGVEAIVVDFRKVLQDSDAAASIQAQLSEQLVSYQDEFDAIEQELLDTQAEIIERRDSMPPEEFNALRRELEQRAAQAQADLQQLRVEFDNARSRAYTRVQEELYGLVWTIAREHGARLVLAKESLVVFDPDLEFTDMALERLNARLPTVEVIVQDPPRDP